MESIFVCLCQPLFWLNGALFAALVLNRIKTPQTKTPKWLSVSLPFQASLGVVSKRKTPLAAQRPEKMVSDDPGTASKSFKRCLRRGPFGIRDLLREGDTQGSRGNKATSVCKKGVQIQLAGAQL